ncbi:MAG: DUF4352 domain-containing protein [SAR202 cluster bacterium]|nr:DUF4352 domain-containing protein [SAR202 cluster bacterium]
MPAVFPYLRGELARVLAHQEGGDRARELASVVEFRASVQWHHDMQAKPAGRLDECRLADLSEKVAKPQRGLARGSEVTLPSAAQGAQGVQPSTTRREIAQTLLNAPSSTPSPTPAPWTPTPTPTSTSTPTPLPPGLARELPVGLRTVVTLSGWDSTTNNQPARVNIRVDQVAFDESAMGVLVSANSFVLPPSPGNTYVVAYVVIDYVSGPPQPPLTLSRYDFWLVTSGGDIIAPTGDMLPGGAVTGWVPWQVPRGSTGNLLRYKAFHNSETAWIRLN